MRTRPTTRSTGSLAATGTVGASPRLLATVHVEPAHTPTTTPMAALREGQRFAWGEPVVRTILLVLAALNVAVIGPVLVGGAVLAEQRLGGADVLGLVFTGFGAGSLLGLLAAGARPPTRRGLVLVAARASPRGPGPAAQAMSTTPR